MKSWGIPAGLNPHHDHRLADYDVWMCDPDSGYWLEAKLDWKSAETGNVCIELEALHHSKAVLFIYGLPDHGKLYIHSFHPWELESLTTAQKLTHSGRFYRYQHRQVGDQPENVGVLVPKEVLKTVGRPFGQAIRLLTNNEHVQMHARN